MPRQPRLVLPEVSLHVVQRGNNRNDCFVDERDYLCYLSCLRDVTAKHGVAVHAYCLMTNHVHLLVTPGDAEGCHKMMRDLGQRYVQYYNKRHRRSGTLWEGRFRSCVVESARYVLACYRYIELNPCRAKLVQHPAAYQWSSHRVNIGQAADILISPHTEFTALGNDQSRQQSAYEILVGEVLDGSSLAEIRDATYGNLPLASQSFRARMLAAGHKIEHGKPGPRKKSLADPEDREQMEIGL